MIVSSDWNRYVLGGTIIGKEESILEGRSGIGRFGLNDSLSSIFGLFLIVGLMNLGNCVGGLLRNISYPYPKNIGTLFGFNYLSVA